MALCADSAMGYSAIEWVMKLATLFILYFWLSTLAAAPLTKQPERLADYPGLPKNLSDAIGRSSKYTTIAFSPAGRVLASGADDGLVRLWDIQTQRLIFVFEGHSNRITSVAFSPDGHMLASASYDRTVRLWDIQKRSLIFAFKKHSRPVRSVAFSPDGRMLASGSDDDTVRLWDIQTQSLVFTFEGHSRRVQSVAFSPDGRMLASASDDRTIRLWNIQKQSLIFVFEGHSSGVLSVAFSPDGRMLASASDDDTVRLWDIQKQSLIFAFEGHSSWVNSVAFSPNGRMLASASSDRTVRFWDIQTQSPIFALEGHTRSVRSVAFSPGGGMLASASFDGAIRLWDIQTQSLIFVLEGHSSWVVSVAFSPDGNTLASASDDRIVKLWDIQNQTLMFDLEGHSSRVNSITFSPDGRMLASASDDDTVRLWDIQKQNLTFAFEGNSRPVNSVTFSPDGRMLASASDDGTVSLWDIQKQSLIFTFKGHSSRVKSVAFSPDGRMLASASYDRTVRLWDIQKQSLIFVFEGHSSRVLSVAFSPDGRMLASASYDGAVRLWDIQTQSLIFTFEGHSSRALSVAFSSDGGMLASASYDGTVRLWDIQKQQQTSTIIGGVHGNWLWQNQDHFNRGDDGTLLQHHFQPVPPADAGKTDDLLISVASKQPQVNNGAGVTLRLNIQNNGQHPAYWIRPKLRQPSAFILYPAQINRLDAGASAMLEMTLSPHVLRQPKPFTEDLAFELTTAAGSRFPVTIPISVKTPALTWQHATFQEDNRTLKIALQNNGNQVLSEAEFTLAGYPSLQAQTLKNIEPQALAELAFVLPEGTVLADNATVSLNSWKSNLPQFEWDFKDKPIILPTSAWTLYGSLTVLLFDVLFVILYLRRYRHPMVVSLSASPSKLLSVPFEQLAECRLRLLRANRLTTVLSDNNVSRQTLDDAIIFQRKAPDHIAWFSQRLQGTWSQLNTAPNLFKLKLGPDFPLNVEQCLLYFPPPDLAATDIPAKLKAIPEAGYFNTVIIGFNGAIQKQLSGKLEQTNNRWIAPAGDMITQLLLSPEPENVLSKLFAAQIPLAQISPYQLGGGTSRASMFFGRRNQIAQIMGREPANYLMVAGRQLGKSSLLKDLYRRYQDQPNMHCYYLSLKDEHLAVELGRALALTGRPSLADFTERLEQLQQAGGQYLFLIDEADDFIQNERKTAYALSNTLRQLSETGKCTFILAGFWHLYDHAVLDYQSPLANFGEVIELGALEDEACRQLAQIPMARMNLTYAAPVLIDELINATGQRANLVAIGCHEILKGLNPAQRMIEAGDVHRALTSEAINQQLEKWKRLSGNDDEDRLDRIIVYAMIEQDHFGLSDVLTFLKEHAKDIPLSSVERSLARLKLAFILHAWEANVYHWRVPLFRDYVQLKEPALKLQAELSDRHP